MTRERMLIVKTGAAVAKARTRYGDFEDWFAHGIGAERFEYRTVTVSDHEPLPSIETIGDYAGIVVTGSPAMVSHRLEWSERTAHWLAQVVAEDRVPVLGVCYGHQLLAHALGGRVGPNPRGRRMGSYRLNLEAPDDALLESLSPQALVHVSHLEVVVTAPPSARVLGRTEADPNHVLHYGGSCWGVQFHPEFDAAIMRCYVEARAELLEDEGFDSRTIVDNVRESSAGTTLLRRFAAICAAERGKQNGESR